MRPGSLANRPTVTEEPVRINAVAGASQVSKTPGPAVVVPKPVKRVQGVDTAATKGKGKERAIEVDDEDELQARRLQMERAHIRKRRLDIEAEKVVLDRMLSALEERETEMDLL
jgi:hypothetical protein